MFLSLFVTIYLRAPLPFRINHLQAIKGKSKKERRDQKGERQDLEHTTLTLNNDHVIPWELKLGVFFVCLERGFAMREEAKSMDDLGEKEIELALETLSSLLS